MSIVSSTTAPTLPTPITHNTFTQLDLEKQSIEVSTGIWRSARFPNNFVARLSDDETTTYQAFQKAVQKYGDSACLGKRVVNPDGTVGEFEFLTFKQVDTRAKNLVAGLVKLGIQPKQHIGIWSKNRIEWQLVAEGAAKQSIITISLYDSLGAESSEFIINHGELLSVCCSGEVLDKLLKCVPTCPTLKFIVCFDPVPKDITCSIPIYSIDEVEQMGIDNPVDDIPPTPEDLFTIMYTSGTTGTPKGVMITHANMISMVASILIHTKSLDALNPKDDSVLGFLPLAHIFGRLVELLAFVKGVRIGYWQGDVVKLVDDIKVLKPTLMATVPRVLDRIYDKIKSTLNTSGWVSKTIFDQAYAIKRAAKQKGQKTPWCDWLVFDKIKQNLGGNMKFIISSGAPLRPEVQDFLGVVFDVALGQAYGATELAGAGFLALDNDVTFGHVGSVLACNEVKLESVPDMNYFNTNNPPSGEVCYRGLSVTQGYYKDEEKTKEAFDSDGFYHTGDIAIMQPNGTLVIVDRLKNMFKLSQGEYVAAEAIENKLGLCKFLSRIWIYGDSFRSVLVSVGVVNTPILVQYLKENGYPDASDANIKTLISEKKVKDIIVNDLTRVGKEAKLQGFELPKAIHLIDHDFAEVTPTLKLQRPQLKNTYNQQIEEMYKSLGQ